MRHPRFEIWTAKTAPAAFGRPYLATPQTAALTTTTTTTATATAATATSTNTRLRISSWQRVSQLRAPPSVEAFQQHALAAGRPVKLAPGSVRLDVNGTWLAPHPRPHPHPRSRAGAADPDLDLEPDLNVDFLQRFASTLYLPMELSVPGRDVFHRADAAPLALFLDAWRGLEGLNRPSSSSSSSSLPPPPPPEQAPRIYIAQSPLSLLPDALRRAFRTPEVVARAGTGDVYGSSLWLGAAPTATPLHRDPNPNVLAQAAGRKVVRLLAPARGSRLYADVMREIAADNGGGGDGGGGGFGADERFRGEGMMKGREKDGLESAVWGDDGAGAEEQEVNVEQQEGSNEADAAGVVEGDAYEAVLDPGDALFIPLGWWHAVRGVGDGVNMSVNWWFR